MGYMLREGYSGGGSEFFQTASSNSNDTEDPTGSSKAKPWNGVSVPAETQNKRIKHGAFPSGYVPNLTPGAKRVNW